MTNRPNTQPNVPRGATGLAQPRGQTRASCARLNTLHPPTTPFRHSTIRHSNLIRHSSFVIHHSQKAK
jgi:hypothetical protein